MTTALIPSVADEWTSLLAVTRIQRDHRWRTAVDLLGRGDVLLAEAAATGWRRHREASGTDELVRLVDRARGGDPGALGELYRRHVDAVYRFVRWQVSDRELAQDLTQDVWLRVARGIPRFRWQGNRFESWVMTITRNVLRDHWRNTGRHPDLVTLPADAADYLPDPVAGPEDLAMRDSAIAEVHVAFGQLAPAYREVLLLRFVLELPVADTARVLHRTAGATKVLQLRAVRALGRELGVPREGPS